MLFFAFDEEKATSAQLVALASDERLAASGGEDHLGRLGSAVAGDYAESPAKPQVLPDQLLPYCFFSDPMPPVLGAGAVVLLPEPDPIPVDPGVVGLVVLPLELEPEPLELPEAPLPALEPLRASRSHFSFSAPVRATHLLALLPDAPEAAPAEPALPEVELSLLPEDELPAAGAVVLLPEDEPVEGVAEGVELLPAAPVPPDDDAPPLPLLEPED